LPCCCSGAGDWPLGWDGVGYFWGGSLVISGALPYTPVVLAMLGVVGVGYALMEVSGQTLLQRLCSDEVLARAFGVVETSYWVMNALGAILAPALVAVVGVRWALVAAGAAPACLAVARWATLMRFEAGVPVPERELALLRGLALFAPLPAATVETLARRLTRIPLHSGDVVIEQGDPGDRFYVIADGRFDVSVSGATRPSVGAGDAFGEIALLRDVPRSATVTAGTDGLLFSLDRDDFLTAVLGHHRSRQVSERTVASRLGEVEAAPPRTARSR
jgi:MFS family permease